jgi:hypothetical protein
MSDGLTFVINPEAQAASIDLFWNALENIRRLLRDVDYAIYRQRTVRRWIIEGLHASAPTITLKPLLDEQEAVNAIAVGIRAVTLGTNEPPEYFTEQALEHLKLMRRLFKGKDRAKSIVVSRNGDETATIRSDIEEKANRILTAGFWNLGSIDGTLDALNFHGAPTLTVWDRVSRTPVRCFIPNNKDWKQRATTLVEKRVLVKGKIRYFANGVPRVITDIEDIRDFSPDPNLPKAEFGSIPDREAARDPVEFLRLIRGLERTG